jgi:hypothetical protein
VAQVLCLSIENAGGNNDTKCLYFLFCLDQAPLTWLESLDKHSIDKWDQLKEQFTSNFVGAMGRSGTRMDLAMVKQEQGETLRKYMCRFFDKSATVVDVTNKEVIDLFQDDLYHRRTFEDFGRRRPKSIPHLKDMITSWADQWTSFSEPGRFPLVLKPVVTGSKLNKVLIDGGSGLNVLFTKTLKKMKLDITRMLTKSNKPFYGIVPCNAAIPLG